MVTTTYLLFVALLGLGAWRWTARTRRGRGPVGGVRRMPGGGLRAMIVGVAGDDDLVERMAGSLVDHTTVFGSSHAIPGHLDAALPAGVLEAATAARPQLTREVVDRYCTLMEERSRRLGRPEFVLPPDYRLHLALTAGSEESLTASFGPRPGGRPGASGPVTVPAPGPVPRTVDDDPTRRRGADELTVRRATRRGSAGRTVTLSVGGTAFGERPLDDLSPVVSVGRGGETALRCPDDLDDVSRTHAELTWIDGRCYVEDMHSANGTWLSPSGGDPVTLVPGAPTPWEPGDVLWLDEDRRARVTLR